MTKAKTKKPAISIGHLLEGVEIKKGVLEIPEEKFEEFLTDQELTLEDLKRGQAAKSTWLVETTREVTEKVADYLRKHPEESSVVMTSQVGYDVQHTHFNRPGENVDPVRHTIETHGTDNNGELRTVHKMAADLFKDI